MLNTTKGNGLLNVAKLIQMFAEPDPNDGGSKNEYSKEEYEALLKERDSFKNRVDELAKNEKALKEQIKSKLSEDEKAKQEKEEYDKQLQEKLAKLESDNLTYKIKGELATSGLDEKAIENFTKYIVANDVDSLVKEISTQFKALKESLTKSIKEELRKQNKLPNGSNENKDEVDADIQDLIDKEKGTQSNNARKFYLGKEK